MMNTKIHQMNFNCKEITITYETFGCSITFSENVNFKNLKVDDFKKNEEQYVMLLRKYAEDEIEENFYYLETNDPLKSGELNQFMINIFRTKISIAYEKDNVEIFIDVDELEFEEVKNSIKKIVNKKGQLNINY